MNFVSGEKTLNVQMDMTLVGKIVAIKRSIVNAEIYDNLETG